MYSPFWNRFDFQSKNFLNPLFWFILRITWGCTLPCQCANWLKARLQLFKNLIVLSESCAFPGLLRQFISVIYLRQTGGKLFHYFALDHVTRNSLAVTRQLKAHYANGDSGAKHFKSLCIPTRKILWSRCCRHLPLLFIQWIVIYAPFEAV